MTLDLEKYSVIVFDLDNTLYSEIEYLKYAYKDIGEKINNLEKSIKDEEVTDFLINAFSRDGRKNLYQKLVKKFSLINFSLVDFLDSFRNVKIPPDSIKINPVIKSFLVSNKDKYKFSIATNGNPVQQKNKIKSIDLPLKKKFLIIYCNLLGEDKNKPSPEFFFIVKNKFNVKFKNILFIGDSEVDKLAATSANIDFIYINNFLKSIEGNK